MAAAAGTSSSSATSKVSERIVALIKSLEADKGKPVTPFNRILLRFPIMAKTLSAVKYVFDEADADSNGTVEYAELKTVMSKLGATMREEDMREVFLSADLYDDGRLTFREFLVCLALGSLLGLVPFSATGLDLSAKAGATAGGVRTAGTGFVSLSAGDVEKSLLSHDGRAIMQTFHLCLEAYVTFDRHHTGVLRREEIEEAMLALTTAGATDSVGERKKHPVPTEALHFLSEERFKELDFDEDGTCSFAEFLFAMFSWVGIEDEEA